MNTPENIFLFVLKEAQLCTLVPLRERQKANQSRYKSEYFSIAISGKDEKATVFIF